MNETIAKWIIEYLIRQKLDDNLINGVISSLPLSNDDYRLKKTILLCKIESKISNNSVSEKILELIEIIEALDNERGETASDLMKEAYCMVAVDCTSRFLEETAEENVKYAEKVEEVWRRRVNLAEGLSSESAKRWYGDIEVAARDEGVCERLLGMNTRKEALKAVKAYLKEAWECLGPSFLELVAAKVGNVVEDVRPCGGVAGAAVFRSGGGDDNVACCHNRCREIVAFEGTQNSRAPLRRKHVAVKGKCQRGPKIPDSDEKLMNVTGDNSIGTGVHDATAEVDRVQKGTVPGSRELSPGNNCPLVDRQTRRTLSSRLPTDNNKNLSDNLKVPEMPTTPDMNRVQEALKYSTGELRAAVSDPLPNALQTAQTLSSAMATENLGTSGGSQTQPIEKTFPVKHRVQEEQRVLPKTRANMKSDDVMTKQAGFNDTGKTENRERRVQEEQRVLLKTRANMKSDDVMTEEAGLNDTGETEKQYNHEEDAHGHATLDPRRKDTVHRRSLMEPNATSHTCEWDDPIEDCSPDSPVRPRLPSPRVTRTSPLKIAKDEKFRVRRKRKRWSSVEEDTLRTGVKKFGHGNWKLILQCYGDIFLDRTDVDLKDKWRNLTRS